MAFVAIAFLAIALVAQGVQPNGARGSRPTARPAVAFNSYFSRCGPGWNGGDSGRSFVLGGSLRGKVAWVWADTLLGSVREVPGFGPRRDLTSFGLPPFIRSSVTLQPSTANPPITESPSDFRTLFGASSGPEAASAPSFPRTSPGFPAYSPACYGPQPVFSSFFPSPPGGAGDQSRWYWPGDGVVQPDGRLQLVLREEEKLGLSDLDIRWVASAIATYEPTTSGSLRLLSVKPGPTSQQQRIEWGAATMRSGSYTYVYGLRPVRTKAIVNAMYVARVPTATFDDLRTWRFWDGDHFDRRQLRSRMIGQDMDSEFSVVRANGRDVLVSVDLTKGLAAARYVRQWVARRPNGPFRRGKALFRMPETGGDRKEFGYAAHVHPEFTSRGRYLISYSVLGPDELLKADDYRPRFVYVRGLGR